MGKIYPATKDEGDGFCEAGNHKHKKEEIENLPLPLQEGTILISYCPAHQLLACQRIASSVYSEYADEDIDGKVHVGAGIDALNEVYDKTNNEGGLIKALVNAKAISGDPIEG